MPTAFFYFHHYRRFEPGANGALDVYTFYSTAGALFVSSRELLLVEAELASSWLPCYMV